MLGSSQHTTKPPNRLEREVQIRFREPCRNDGADLWEMAGSVGLDLNSPYAYVMCCEYFAGSSVVAVDEDEALVGFVLGFRPPAEPDAVFVWQVAVSPEARGGGIGGRLLDELVARCGASLLEATVTPSNQASAALFRTFAARKGAALETAVAYPTELFPVPHEEEVRYRIGPLRDVSDLTPR